MYSIYKITNLVNGKIYIGQTKGSVEDRLKRHICDANRGSRLYLHNAIRTYGEQAFDISVIDSCKTHQQANELEIRYIKEFKALDSSIGYNMAPGGEGGNTYYGKTSSEMFAIRSKISNANKGEHNGNHRVLFMKDLQTGKQLRFGAYAECERYFLAKGITFYHRDPLNCCRYNKQYGIQQVLLGRYIFRYEEDEFKLYSYYKKSSGEVPYKAINTVTNEKFIGLTRKECLEHIGLDPKKRNPGNMLGNWILSAVK